MASWRLFGAPLAHEDHALRACYAALAMQSALRAMRRGAPHPGDGVQMRVGLNSGEVVVRAIGNDLHMDYSAVGPDHPSGRAHGTARHTRQYRLTVATLRLVEGLVQVTALGPVPVKGLAEPVEVFELLGVSPLRRRLQAAAGPGTHPLCGATAGADLPEEALHRGLAHLQAAESL